MSAPTILSPQDVEARVLDFKARDVKKVTLTIRPNEGEEATPLEGELITASSVGLMFRKRGRQDADLYSFEQVGNIEELAAKPKALRSKVLAPVKLDTAREHLVDRHGYKLKEIDGLDPQAAYDFHATLDHTELGHSHSSGNQAEAAPTATPEG